MATEPNEDQRIILEKENERLRAENERLRVFARHVLSRRNVEQAKIERLQTLIEKCGGYCWNVIHEPDLTQAVEDVIDKIFKKTTEPPRE